MNQRQKKKSSQNRKRHFDGVKAKEAKEAQASGTQKNQTKEQTKPRTPAAETKPHKVNFRHKTMKTFLVASSCLLVQMQVQEDVAKPVERKVEELEVSVQDQRKFSKRKIVSNWAKYDEGEWNCGDSQ